MDNCFKKLLKPHKKIMKHTILVTGGAGYIGSHTILELLEKTDFDVISIDNYSNSSSETYQRIKKITQKEVEHYNFDLCDKEALFNLLDSKRITGIIHFAAFKSVPESVENPYKYYSNNLSSLLNIIEGCTQFSIPNLIFSSSCSVYGNIDKMPVSEISELNEAESPYAHTKQIGEAILEQYSKTAATFQTVALRYFNPVGAHKSGLIGESPVNPPTSLIPIITQTAIGIRPSMQVHGADYPTRDGSCIRDYIHVSDIGEAHVKALNYLINGESDLKYDVINLGTGSGVTVFEAIESFKENTGVNLNYNVGPRRNGDVTAIYSDTTKSEKLLNWKATTPLSEMVTSAWKWQQELNINTN